MLSRHIALLVAAFALYQVALAASSAEANHILVASEERCNTIKSEILSSPDQFEAFKNFAKSESTCPSGKSGGSLGTFGPGQMVREFDDVIFKTGSVGQVEGCVKTQFGYHLIWIVSRT